MNKIMKYTEFICIVPTLIVPINILKFADLKY